MRGEGVELGVGLYDHLRPPVGLLLLPHARPRLPPLRLQGVQGVPPQVNLANIRCLQVPKLWQPPGDGEGGWGGKEWEEEVPLLLRHHLWAPIVLALHLYWPEIYWSCLVWRCDQKNRQSQLTRVVFERRNHTDFKTGL